jgi:hypothetical protein
VIAPLFLLALERSESPYHKGTYCLYLEYDLQTQKWSLKADPRAACDRLSSKKGSGNEDPKTVAIDLLKKSYDRDAFTFDVISDGGPFDLTRKDFISAKTRWIETSQPIDPPDRICKYCRYLQCPRGMGEAILRIYDCKQGKWTDKERGIPENDRSGKRSPNLEFSCTEFAPEFRRVEQVYY